MVYAAPRSQKTDRRQLEGRPGVPEGARAASGCGARGVPVLRGSSSRHPVSGWWRRRRGRHDHAVPPRDGSPAEGEGRGGGEEEGRREEEEEEEEGLKRIRNIPLNQLTPLQRQKLASWIEKEKEKAKAAVGILPSTSSSFSGPIRKRKKKRRKRTRRRC